MARLRFLCARSQRPYGATVLLLPQLIIDRAVQRGTKKRPAKLVTHKNNEALVLDVSQDILDALRWHVRQGYSGPEFFFSEEKGFPICIDSALLPARSAHCASVQSVSLF